MGSKVIMVHHLNVQITDRQRTREWYERALGCTFLDRGELTREAATAQPRQRRDALQRGG